MRREFILILLGIICVSTLSSLLSDYVQIDTEKVLLDTVVGAVGAGNFSFWQLGHSGPLMIELTSISGDADIYVADTIRPSYEIDRNNFSSATCGVDLVNIPADFPRPIGIAVFGHWSHHVSEYSIQVFLETSNLMNAGHMHMYHKHDTETEKKKEEIGSKEEDEESKPMFMMLLNLLDMIFEMFVL